MVAAFGQRLVQGGVAVRPRDWVKIALMYDGRCERKIEDIDASSDERNVLTGQRQHDERCVQKGEITLVEVHTPFYTAPRILGEMDTNLRRRY